MTVAAEQVLRARAAALARPIEPESAPRDHYLGFEIARARFAVELTRLVAVRRARRPTPMPGAPSWLPGLIAIEGTVVPALRLDLLLGADRDETQDSPPAWAVIMASGADRVGLIAEVIVGMLPAALVEGSVPDGLPETVYRTTTGKIGDFLVLSPVGLLQAIEGALVPSHPGRNPRTTIEGDQG